MQWIIFDRVHRGVLSLIPANFVPSNILDIGCGTGRLLRRMHARWPSASLVGVDVAEGMVAQAREQTEYATIHQAPAEQLPLENASVDLATSTTSFHHWSDQAKGVSEAVRVLRVGGLFILADMNLAAHGNPISRPRCGRYLRLPGCPSAPSQARCHSSHLRLGKKRNVSRPASGSWIPARLYRPGSAAGSLLPPPGVPHPAQLPARRSFPGCPGRAWR